MPLPSFAPRLHVLTARESPLAVVLRRGPSKKVASILWDRSRDAFTLGQWLSGRIYERRSDLSPDGRFLIYFAMNGRWTSETGGSYTAISRAPYLKALVLLGKGDGWHGGGLWTGKAKYWLNDGFGHKLMRTNTLVKRDEAFVPDPYFGGECPGVYYPRLLRDGWTLSDDLKAARHHDVTIFEKPVANGWILRKLAHAQIGAPPGKGCYWDEHELEKTSADIKISCADWEWCDFDADRKRIVWAADGKLHAAKLGAKGLGEVSVLHDFNPMTFESIKAPY